MAQTLARHSDINLTMITYAQVGLRDKAAAVASLPPFFAAVPERQEEGKAAE